MNIYTIHIYILHIHKYRYTTQIVLNLKLQKHKNFSFSREQLNEIENFKWNFFFVSLSFFFVAPSTWTMLWIWGFCTTLSLFNIANNNIIAHLLHLIKLSPEILQEICTQSFLLLFNEKEETGNQRLCIGFINIYIFLVYLCRSESFSLFCKIMDFFW